MTARSLLNSLPARNMKRAIGEHRKLSIVMMILQILGIPMAAAALMLDMILESMLDRGGYYRSLYFQYDADAYVIIAVICFGAAVIVGMIAAASVFQEMWKKTKVDMLCSLPLTGKQRFLSHYLAGAWSYLLPYVIGVVLGWLVILIGSCIVDFDALEYFTRSEFLGELCPLYTYGTLGMFLLMTLYYTITVLVTVCCGTYFETIYTTLLLNCLVPGTIAAVLLVITDNVYALDFGYLWQCIGFTSPIGGLIYMMYLISVKIDGYYGYAQIYGTEVDEFGILPAFTIWAVWLVILIAAALIGAMLLYKRRKAEEVGKPFVYHGAYFLMLTLLTVLILCMVTVDALMPAIIFSAIVYFVMEVIRKRGFRRFWLSAICYACTAAVTIGMFALSIKTDVFGTVYHIPALSSIHSLEISLWRDPNQDITMRYTDKEIIKAVRELHKELASDMKNDGSTVKEINDRLREEDVQFLAYGVPEEYYNGFTADYYYTEDPEEVVQKDREYYYYDNWTNHPDGFQYAPTEHISLTYTTHLGNEIHRTYDCNIDQLEQLMDILCGTEIYAEACKSWMTDRLWSRTAEYNEEMGKTVLPSSIQLSLHHYYSEAEQTVITGWSQSGIEEITTAYSADIARIGNDTGGLYGLLFGEFPIWNNCTETIAVLEDMGMRPFTVPEKFGVPDVTYEEFFQNHYQNYNYQAQPLDVRIYAPEDYALACDDFAGYAMTSGSYVRKDAEYYETSCYCTEYTSLEKDEPELYALLNAVELYYKSDQPCYAVIVNGVWFTLPAEDSALAEVFFE